MKVTFRMRDNKGRLPIKDIVIAEVQMDVLPRKGDNINFISGDGCSLCGVEEIWFSIEKDRSDSRVAAVSVDIFICFA